MRPAVGSSAGGASPRKRSPAEAESNIAHHQPSSTAPTSFFIASERQLDAGNTPKASIADSSFGIRSLGEEAMSLQEDKESEAMMSDTSRRRSTLKPRKPVSRDTSMDSIGIGSLPSSQSSSPSRLQRRLEKLNPESANHPLTPLSFASPTLDLSEPSSPKSMSSRSLRPSDDEFLDDRSSQAVVSDGEDEDAAPFLADSTVAPQFIMPSIMMPSRRPFTKRGQELGKLKILLAGRAGVGKTSLIRSIVQLCEDIVHIDSSPSSNSLSKKESKCRSRGGGIAYNRTKKILEIFASTKSYPDWWSDLEGSSVLRRRRRRSGNDTVLERNLCFIDTPGFDSGTSNLEGMDKVGQYIENQMSRAVDAPNMEDGELLNLLGGTGGSHVDIVLYLSDRAYTPDDLEFLRQLSQLTNVIPLLTKVDTIDASDLERLKASMAECLADAGIKPFRPAATSERGLSTPVVVCSSPSKDLENMDASLLMQSDYIQPLHPSQLNHLLDTLFSSENLSQLKHFAAKKLLRARKAGRGAVGSSPSPFRTGISPSCSPSNTAPLLNESFASVSQALISRPTSGALTYNRAQVADHTLREERLARVHLANWAANLQRSLQNERARYEIIARAERAEWLKARLGECTLEGDLDDPFSIDAGERRVENRLVPTRSDRGGRCRDSPDIKEKKDPLAAKPRSSVGMLDYDDPLGLMRLRDQFTSTSWVTLKVVGVSGVLGALVWWAAKTWNFGLAMGPNEEGGWMGRWQQSW